MIRYALSCPQNHAFESWFQSASAFDSLLAAGHVACPQCASLEVRKTLMAPAVKPGRKADAPAPKAASGTPARPLSDPANPREEALAAMRRDVEANSDYVGSSFALEARRMHEGQAPERSIYGEARPEEARKLLQDGIPILPLPFMPGRKTN